MLTNAFRKFSTIESVINLSGIVYWCGKILHHYIYILVGCGLVFKNDLNMPHL